MHEFKPDWTIAPAVMLKFYLDENHLSPRVAVASAAHRDARDEAAKMLEEILDKKPLTLSHALLLQSATGIPKELWLTFEHNYRVGLAAGRIDAT
jgi:plasmid maintenance system antidote protein VapI